MLEINPLSPEFKDQVAQKLIERWHSREILAHGQLYDSSEFEGFLCLENEEILGILTYRLIPKEHECEIMTLDSFKANLGIGTILIDGMVTFCKRHRIKRLWLVTSNDNINAFRFYQKRGFRMRAVYPYRISNFRHLKPEIPLIGEFEIPISDEVEFDMVF